VIKLLYGNNVPLLINIENKQKTALNVNTKIATLLQKTSVMICGAAIEKDNENINDNTDLLSEDSRDSLTDETDSEKEEEKKEIEKQEEKKDTTDEGTISRKPSSIKFEQKKLQDSKKVSGFSISQFIRNHWIACGTTVAVLAACVYYYYNVYLVAH
jgi:hypothetical protein